MRNKFLHYFSHDSLFRFVLISSVGILIIESILLIWMPSKRVDERRARGMKLCVDFSTATPGSSCLDPSKQCDQYEVRFEDEFFCPTQTYTVLEVLQRADSVLNTRQKHLNIVLSATPGGIIVTSMLGVENGPNGRWLPAIGGSYTTDKPLDKIVLEGPSWVSFMYE
jgi:hypothetical protein